MEVIENRTTGKRHLPGDDSTTLCGEQLIAGGNENATWIDDEWLDDFPEDYGDSHMDCQRCANKFEI